jgi:hypothetical protein
MKTGSLWIIRLALTVQFLGVLSVPVLVAVAESPRRDSNLTFVEQLGHRVATTLDRALQLHGANSR